MTVFFTIIQGFISLFSIIRLTQMSTTNPLTIVFFATLCFIYYQFTKNNVACRVQVGDKWCSFLLSIIFTILTIFAKFNVVLLNSVYLAEKIAIITLTSIGLMLIFYYILLWFFIEITEVDWNRNLYSVKALPIITSIGSLIIFSLYCLINFPGILTESTNVTFQQINGEIMMNDNPSLTYTVLLDKLYKLAFSITKNTMYSIAILTFLQILLLSFIAGYLIKTLQIAHIHTNICVLCSLFYLIPYHGVMASTLSVNVLLSANLVGYCAVTLRLLLKSDQKDYSKFKWFTVIVPYFIFGFMLCMLSRSGMVTFIITLPFILITLNEKWKVTIPVTLVIFAIIAFIKFPFMRIYGIERPEIEAIISPTLLQIFNHSSDVSTWSLIKQFINENILIWYPQLTSLDTSIAVNETAIINCPLIIKDLLLTMQTCIPLYGLIWSPGIIFWTLLISMFLCARCYKPENIPFILPLFIFVLSSEVFIPDVLGLQSLYSLFLALPLILFVPFVDAESEY